MKLYTIYDSVAEEAGPVFCAVNDGVAMRQYLQVMKNVDDKDAFSLYFLGEYDSKKMVVSPFVAVEVRVADLVAKNGV